MQKQTALLVIDMEQGFIDSRSPLCIAGAAATIPNCAKVIRACRERNIPVFFVNRRYRANGSDVEHTRFAPWLKGNKPLSPGCPEEISEAIPEEFGFCDRDYLIYKPRFSAFFGTELDLILRRLCVNTLLLAGTTTPNCIRTTCYDGISLEYNIAVLSDCTSSVNEDIQSSNLRDMANIGAELISTSDFISGSHLPGDSAGEAQAAIGRI